MQEIKDLLLLHLAGGVASRRELAPRLVGCSKTAVSDCLRRTQLAGLRDWLLAAGLGMRVRSNDGSIRARRTRSSGGSGRALGTGPPSPSSLPATAMPLRRPPQERASRRTYVLVAISFSVE